MLIEDLKLFDLKETDLIFAFTVSNRCLLQIIIFGAYVYGSRLQTNTKLLLTLKRIQKLRKKKVAFTKSKYNYVHSTWYSRKHINNKQTP